ncbi:hypothetical protein [Sphingomonas endolithica]|uniref:hypothetical protein n=1 Tax=Sphingomonas endolithica TaxID=2972485 RepID=UPI0021AF9865|nr:hypothetical protein [Sphingomonas sp. ZFBP2030]
MTNVQPAQQVTLTVKNCTILAFGMIITAFLALGSHDLAIAHLGIPYPNDGDAPPWARYVGQVVRLGAMVYVCRLASWYLDRHNIYFAAAFFGLLVVLLQETLRVIVVDNIVSDGWVDLRWVYLLMTRLPNALLSFYSGAIAVVIARKVGSDRPVAMLLAVVLASAIGYFGLLPVLKFIADLVTAMMHLTETPEVHTMPYGIYVYKYIYGMFIEPTISSFIIIYLLWPVLKGSKFRRVALFVLLMLLMRGRIVATGLFSFWIKDSWWLAFAAEGQFLVETFVLAALTGVTWAVITPKAAARTDYAT